MQYNTFINMISYIGTLNQKTLFFMRYFLHLLKNVIKICDFGWSVYAPLSRGTLCGTPIYASPELVQRKQYDSKLDIWNIGVLTYELLYGRVPFEIRCEEDLQKVVIIIFYLRFTKKYISQNRYKLVTKLKILFVNV